MMDYRKITTYKKLKRDRVAKSAGKYGSTRYASMDYLDVRWKKLRDSAMIRDGYVCKMCGGVEDLQVHHTRYIKGGKIWDSPIYDLVTLCRECHKAVHKLTKPQGKERRI